MNRRRFGAIAMLPAIAVLAIAGTALVGAPAQADAHGAHGAQATRASFHDAMRKLWEEHIVWTRQFIVSAATQEDNLADIGPTVDRLLANQADIGNAIKPYYGDAAGDALTELLRQHILTAADIVTAAKAGNSAGVEAASTAWYANGDEIAAFLSNANPRNWPLAEMQTHMRSHLDLTLEEAVARLQGRYADDIAAYDRIHADILGMADMLSDGIIAQFPSRFAR
jgi:hypothetical protein